VADIGTGGAAGVAFFHVRRGAMVEFEGLVRVERFGKAGAADHVAAGIGNIARAEGIDAVSLAETTVWTIREVVRIECACACHVASKTLLSHEDRLTFFAGTRRRAGSECAPHS